MKKTTSTFFLALLISGVSTTIACTEARPLAEEHSADDGCYDCHGNAVNGNSAPPRVIWTDSQGRDLHQIHLQANDMHAALSCDNCHVVPEETHSEGHIDSELPAEIVFGGISAHGGLTPAYDSGSCSNTYCHGAGFDVPPATAPKWSDENLGCDSCHGFPPAGLHVQRTDCGSCHESADNDGNIIKPELHIDTTVQTDTLGCNACHGGSVNSAPPMDTLGNTATSFASVGAHQAHLGTSDWHTTISCNECHTVPADLDDAGHFDSALPAENNFGTLANAGGVTTLYADGTCTTYCHGAGLQNAAGSVSEPKWTQVDGTQAACGSCHGMAPGAPHVQRTDCETCHGNVVDASGQFVDASLHINGAVNLSAEIACNACHGNFSADASVLANSAPPTDTNGLSDSAAVGAHAAHLQTSSWHAPLKCNDCHVVPATYDAAGHMDTVLPAEVDFANAPILMDGDAVDWSGTLNYDSATKSCTVYCHNPNPDDTAAVTHLPEWDGDNPGSCSSCHGFPPTGHMANTTNCSMCHSSGGLACDGANHIDGVVTFGGSCP
ncbi:CxxxxCH/CxxCH domain-containing protein [Myxococcota bacterium]|nr:CxxxxCH/CxxCH domain-containing protein [Myxococcota bacterium]